MKTIHKMIIAPLLLALCVTAHMSAQDTTSANGKTAVVRISTSAQCDQCKKRIEKQVSLMSGVKKADLDLSTKVLTVEYNPKKTSPEKIRKTISETGYDADDVKASSRAEQKLPPCCRRKDPAQ